jgi:hypothetical protein
MHEQPQPFHICLVVQADDLRKEKLDVHEYAFVPRGAMPSAIITNESSIRSTWPDQWGRGQVTQPEA